MRSHSIYPNIKFPRSVRFVLGPALGVAIAIWGTGGLRPATAVIHEQPQPTSGPSYRIAQGFNPPDGRGMPGRREGGGTRGGIVIHGTPPIALIPPSNLGTTLTGHPTFFFYVPAETGGMNAEFQLLTDQGDLVYQAMIPLPFEEGILSLPLPESMADLELQRDYQWFFSVVVLPDDPSGDINLSGWVHRRSPDPSLTQQLEAALPADQPGLYGAAGIWHEALDVLAALRLADPQNVTLQSQWTVLLESVDLGAIAPKPLLGSLLPSEPLPQMESYQAPDNRGYYRREEGGETR